MALAINNDNFEEITSTDKVVLIDFWAEWCGPCRMMSPIVDELAAEYGDKTVICKCDVEESDEVAARFMIRNIPTIILLKNGQQVDKQVGACSKAELKAKLEKAL